MEILEKYKEKIEIDESALYQVFVRIFKSSNINTEYKSIQTIQKKEDINNLFIQFIEQGLQYNLFEDKTQKAFMIKILSKMYLKKEILEIMEGKLNIEGLEAASKNLSKKSQSSFKSK